MDEELRETYLKISANSREVFRELMAHWIPFPSAAYWKQFDIEPNQNGTVTTPSGIIIPTRELCEINDLEELYGLE